MPNGGIPLHMTLFPKDGSPFVIYCRGADFKLYARDVWDREGAAGTPLCAFTTEEAAAVTWFLNYFIGEAKVQPGWHMGPKINAKFDF